jgi:hypothetical protein
MTLSQQIANREQWQLLVEEQEKSGQTQTEFCKQRNLSAAKFSYYRSLFKMRNRSLSQENIFSPVQIKKREISEAAEIKIILPNGFQCLMPVTIESTQVKRLIEALLSC